MKIVSLKAIPITHSEHHQKSAKYLHEYPLNHLFVRVDTDEGTTGYGEVSDNYGCSYPLSVKAIIDEVLGPMLLGEDANAIQRLVVKMRGWTRREFCDQGVIIQAISGVEIALWDALGKAQNKSVTQLLGRYRDQIPVYASGTMLEEGPAEFHLKLFEPCLSHGVSAIKVRLGLDYKRDLKTLHALRRLIGDDIDILVDGSEHFSVTTALGIAKALADLGVLFFEEPVPQHSRDEIAQLVEKSPLPIAYGEHLFTTHDFQDWLKHRRVNVVQPDAAISGGIAECRRIAALAESFGVWVVPHSAAGPLVLAANLHLCASIANIWMLEYAFTLDRLWKEMLVEPILSPNMLRDGKLAVPSGPGLGLMIDEEVWQRHPYQPRALVQSMPTWALGHV